MSSVDLNNQGYIYYLDKNQQLKKEPRKTVGSAFNRTFIPVTGQRTYNLEKLVAFVNKNASVEESDRKYLNYQFAKKERVDQETFEKMVQILNNPVDQTALQNITEHLCQHPQEIKHLKAYSAKLEKGTLYQAACNLALKRARILSKYQELQLQQQFEFEKHYDDIEYLFDTRLMYSIVGFQNTTKEGMETHAIKTTDDGLMIKKEGEWVAVSEVKQGLNWDKTEGMPVSKDNPDERWNYLSPNGLVPIDRYFHHESLENNPNYPMQNATLQPVEKLSHEEMELLRAHANGTDEQPCVFQIVTHPRKVMGKSMDQWWNKHLHKQFPIHCGIRVIKSDGTVYSTGFGSTLHEDKYNEGLKHYLSTINGQPTILDYEEFRKHEGRITTSIPVSEEKIEEILELLNLYRSHSIRFNILKQNCMRLGAVLLLATGENLELTSTIGELFTYLLPNPSDIPIVKNILPKGKKKEKKEPSKAVQVAKDFVNNKVLYLPRKGQTVLGNLLLLSFGAKHHSPINPQTEEIQEHLQPQKAIISDNKDLLDDHLTEFYHSTKMVEWQLNQASTVVHPYKGQPSMQIYPEAEDAEQHKELKELFQKIFLIQGAK